MKRDTNSIVNVNFTNMELNGVINAESDIELESDCSMDDYIESDFSEEIRAGTPYAQEERCQFELEFIRWSEHTQLLVRHITESHYADDYGSMSLHTAVLENNQAMLDVLLQQPDIDLNDTTCEKNTVLHLALKMKRSYSFVMRLIKAGCDLGARNIHKETPLHVAVLRLKINVAHELIKRGVDINVQDERKRTPLHYAVLCKNLAAMCLLLFYGADVHALARDSKTLFEIALLCSCSDIVQVLEPYYDVTAMLLSAAKVRNQLGIDFAIGLVKAGADVNCLDDRGNNLLSLSLHDHSAVLFELVWQKIDRRVLSYKQSFLSSFVYCEFPPAKWLSCLHSILESPLAHLLVSKKDKHDHHLFYLILETLDKKDAERTQRLAIIYHLLRLGLGVSEHAVEFVYKHYGFNEELEAIIYCSACNRLADSNEFLYLQLKFFFAAEKDPMTEKVFHFFREQIHRINLWAEERPFATMFSLRFYSLPTRLKQDLVELDRGGRIAESVRRMPEIPSLLELCRNQTRRFIRSSCKIKTAYRFYDAVKELNLPPVIEDIVCFIMPLY